MLYGIMLVYYPEFYQKSILEFNSLLKRIDNNAKLIIISNNNLIHDDVCILGNNKNWEFTGWDVGLNQIPILKDDDSVIFANDTFMYNNPYGKLKAFFIKTIFQYCYQKNFKQPQILMSGSTCGLNQEYTIKDTKANFWVSTYLFFMSGKLLNMLNKQISINEEELSSLVGLENKKFIFSNDISLNMQKHLQDWLYPINNIENAWYKALEASDEVKLRKVKTIINEKYLSSFCISANGTIIDINPKKTLVRLFNSSYV